MRQVIQAFLVLPLRIEPLLQPLNRTDTMLLEGLHIPLTTPFHSDGRINLHKLASNIARYSKTPAAGLIVLGPSGESTLLDDEETREVLRTTAQSAAPDKVLTANISRDSVHATLTLANFAAEQNYDAVLVAPPSFLAPEAGLARLDADMQPIPLLKNWLVELQLYFQAVADRSPLPVILLNVRGRTLFNSQARKVSYHPNIIGLYGASQSPQIQNGTIASMLQHTASIRRDVTVTSVFTAVTARMERATEAASVPVLISANSLANSAAAVAEPPSPAPALRTRAKTVGFQILSANSRSLLEALSAGATGIAPPFAAAAPQACYEVFAAWKDGDQPLAEEKQSRIIAAAKLAEASPAALKHACDLNGYYGGPPRLPHLPLTAAQRAELEQLMQPLRN
jgi:4-hydroxy-2-oxoglutarate aldolase